MAMNYFLVIVNTNNKFFSQVKSNSPKMYNSMKELCTKYEGMFNEVYKVKRVVPIKTGWKFI